MCGHTYRAPSVRSLYDPSRPPLPVSLGHGAVSGQRRTSKGIASAPGKAFACSKRPLLSPAGATQGYSFHPCRHRQAEPGPQWSPTPSHCSARCLWWGQAVRCRCIQQCALRVRPPPTGHKATSVVQTLERSGDSGRKPHRCKPDSVAERREARSWLQKETTGLPPHRDMETW